jgi:hypothetical protein
MAVLEVGERADDQQPLVVGGVGVGVELGPVRVAFPGVRVEQHDRGVVLERERGDAQLGDPGVVPRDAPVLETEGGDEVEAGDVGEGHRAGREPVVAVPLGGVDRLAEDVAGHRERGQVDAQARGRGVVRGGEPVVREGQQAAERVGRVAALAGERIEHRLERPAHPAVQAARQLADGVADLPDRTGQVVQRLRAGRQGHPEHQRRSESDPGPPAHVVPHVHALVSPSSP